MDISPKKTSHWSEWPSFKSLWITNAGEGVKKRKSSDTVGESIVDATTRQCSMEGPQKTKSRITIWSSNPTPGHISGQNSNSKRYMHICVHRSTIHSIQDMSTDRWIDREEMVHIYSGMIVKKGWNNAIWSNMDVLYKWSKSERERQIPNDITYMWNLRCDTNKSTNETEIDSRT